MPFCPQCGVDNPANARFCDQCGAALIPVPGRPAGATQPQLPATQPQLPAAPPPLQPANAAPAVPVSSGALTCPQCGAAAIPGEAFCDNCGAPLNAPARSAAPAPAPPYSSGVPAQPSYPPPQPSSFQPTQPAAPAYTPPPQPAYTPPPQPAYTPPPPPPQPAYTPPPAPARSLLEPSSLVVAASGATIRLPAAAQAIVGRGDAVSNYYPDVDLNPHGALDNGVGRRHLRLLVQGGQLLIEDLDSTNGTMLNGQRLAPRQPQPLRDGDQIVVGKLLLRFAQ